MSADTSRLAKLAITCTLTSCDQDLHCFRSTKKLVDAGLGGACRDCHAQLVDWPRVHERRLDDAEHTFTELRLKLIRHHFGHLEIDEKARDDALRKGRIALEAALAKRLASSVGPEMPYRDGAQTPMSGNIIYYAQHATPRAAGRASSTGTGSQRGVPFRRTNLPTWAISPRCSSQSGSRSCPTAPRRFRDGGGATTTRD